MYKMEIKDKLRGINICMYIVHKTCEAENGYILDFGEC